MIGERTLHSRHSYVWRGSEREEGDSSKRRERVFALYLWLLPRRIDLRVGTYSEILGANAYTDRNISCLVQLEW